jgi:hypothetical protein
MHALMAHPTTRREKRPRDGCKIQPSLARRNAGDVGDPNLVGRVDGEVAVERIRSDRHRVLGVGRVPKVARSSAKNAVFPHQACDATTTHFPALFEERFVHAHAPVRVRSEGRIGRTRRGDPLLRRRPRLPRVPPECAHVEAHHLLERRDGVNRREEAREFVVERFERSAPFAHGEARPPSGPQPLRARRADRALEEPPLEEPGDRAPRRAVGLAAEAQLEVVPVVRPPVRLGRAAPVEAEGERCGAVAARMGRFITRSGNATRRCQGMARTFVFSPPLQAIMRPGYWTMLGQRWPDTSRRGDLARARASATRARRPRA